MTERHDALRMSRSLLRMMIALNIALGICILALFVVSLIPGVPLMRALGVHATAGIGRVIFGMRLIMIVGLAATPVTHVMLTRLLGIVDTVHVGDAFIAQNAVRLKTIAWALAGLEALHLVEGAVVTSAPLDIHWHFSLTGLLAIVLTFVLARVFEEGAHMREDLEGTV